MVNYFLCSYFKFNEGDLKYFGIGSCKLDTDQKTFLVRQNLNLGGTPSLKETFVHITVVQR